MSHSDDPIPSDETISIAPAEAVERTKRSASRSAQDLRDNRFECDPFADEDLIIQEPLSRARGKVQVRLVDRGRDRPTIVIDDDTDAD